ncbi:MAG: hypothetical protein ACI8TP_001356 [Acidimicrobiales bacterium]|jgi:hypothetical protein
MDATLHRLAQMFTGLLLALVTSGCTATEPTTEARDAAIYREVLDALMVQAPIDISEPGSDDEPSLPILYVRSLDPSGIPLETQVAMVAMDEAIYELRFIDDMEEAIEIDLENQPVREGGALVGLGPIDADADAGVRGELYLERDNVVAYRFVLQGDDQTWTVDGDPVEVEPEGFVTNP